MVQADNGLKWFAWCHETRHALNAKICQGDKFGILRTCVNMSCWQFWYCDRHSLMHLMRTCGQIWYCARHNFRTWCVNMSWWQFRYCGRHSIVIGEVFVLHKPENKSISTMDSSNWAYSEVHVAFVWECPSEHCRGQWGDCVMVLVKHASQQVRWLCVHTD